MIYNYTDGGNIEYKVHIIEVTAFCTGFQHACGSPSRARAKKRPTKMCKAIPTTFDLLEDEVLEWHAITFHHVLGGTLIASGPAFIFKELGNKRLCTTVFSACTVCLLQVFHIIIVKLP